LALFIKDCSSAGELELEYFSTDQMVGDCFPIPMKCKNSSSEILPWERKMVYAKE
jgi:hypothetical protein